MAENPETTLTRKVREHLKSRGCYFVKYPGGDMGEAGTPDLLCCHDGRFVGLELKLPYPSRHGVSKIQALRIRQIRKAGGLAGAACSIEEVDAVLRGDYASCQREKEIG